MQCACAIYNIFLHSHKEFHFRGEKKLLIKMCPLTFFTPLWKITLSKNNPRIYHYIPRMYHYILTDVCTWSTHCSFQILMKTQIQQIFRKILKYQLSLNSGQWEPNCSMRTDTTEPAVAFQNFANAPKNCEYPNFHTRTLHLDIIKTLFTAEQCSTQAPLGT